MYTVIWKAAILDRLAELYVDADRETRERMASGVAALNVRLANDPRNEGESRGGTTRIAFPALLTVTFYIDEAQRVVRVTAVSRYGP